MLILSGMIEIVTPGRSLPESPDRRNPHLRIHAVNIYVRDQDRSLAFYVDQLGFSVAFDARLQSGERWVAVAPPDGSAVLALVVPKPDSREYALIGRATHIVFVTENVIAKYDEWRRRGVRFHHTPRLRRVTYRPAGPGSAGRTGDVGGRNAGAGAACSRIFAIWMETRLHWLASTK